MKKTNLTFYKKLRMHIAMMVFFGSLAFSVQTNAQSCALACGDDHNISLSPTTCEATITPEFLGLETQSECTGGRFYIEVLDKHGDTIPNDIVTYEYVGQRLQFGLYDSISGNNCWGHITVEDKAAPVIDCPGDTIVVECGDVEDFTPTFTDNCGAARTELRETVLASRNNNCRMGLPDTVLRIITKRYVAVDQFGNESPECIVNIVVTATTDTVTYPRNYMYIPGEAIRCDDKTYKYLPNGHPSPTGEGALKGTGVPSIGTKSLAEPDNICGIMASYTDTNLGQTNCVTKIMRRWEIVSWNCATASVYPPRIQIIEIADTLAPTFDLVDRIDATTQGHNCEARVQLPMPTNMKDNCGDVVRVTVNNYDNDPVVVNLIGSTRYANLPAGINKLYYDVYDSCNNVSRDSIEVHVADNTPPVPVCVERTVVSLTTDGHAWLKAKVFDKGSYDECQLKTMVVRRMNTAGCDDCEIPTFDHMTYKGEYNGKYYYLSKHKFNYEYSIKHIEALGGRMTNIYAGGALGNWLTTNVRDTDGDGDADADDEVLHSYRRPTTDSLYFVMELTDLCGFSNHVKFCCSDLTNDENLVVLRVIDHAGNWNECMVNTTVQDKIAPTLVCPADTTINCDVEFDLENLSAYFGTATVEDNCNVLVPEESVREDLNSCKVGWIYRTFSIPNPDGSTQRCTQRIRVIPNGLFNGRTIGWPRNQTVTECSDPNSNALHPDNTGYPRYNDNTCSLVGHRWTDETYIFNESGSKACFKILRKWQVIDWCNYDSTTGKYAIWTHTQEIKVIDRVAPTIKSSLDPVSVCTYDADCKDGYIELSATGEDNCNSAAMEWTYAIDANNDGSFEAGLSKSGKGPNINASGTYPVGTHRILYTFRDKCGNTISKEQLFSIVSCKAPSPYCLQGVVSTLMPVTENNKVVGGMIEIWANDFDNGTATPCGYDTLYFSFEPIKRKADGSLDIVFGRTYTCDSIGERSVNIYTAVVTPTGEIIQDYCKTTIDIQDNSNVCPSNADGGDNTPVARVSGTVTTGQNATVKGASINLVGSELPIENTADNGNYAFPAMPYGGKYVVQPSKDDAANNGVNTRDLLAIQRHILGKNKLTSPYDLIAADANKDGKINAKDLLLIRKVILRLTEDFNGSKAWRFVDKAYEFKNAAKAQAEVFPEVYEIAKLNSDMSINFVAVKLGDVNASAKISSVNNSAADVRSEVAMVAPEVQYAAGSKVEVPVSLSRSADMAGFQFTLDYDVRSLDLVNVKSDVINIDASNVAVLNNNGVVTVSWNGTEDINIDATQTVFTLVFDAKSTGSTASLAMNSDATEAEFYTVDNTYALSLDIEARDASENVFAVYQNVPNPFRSSTTIKVDVPAAIQGTLTIHDVTGQVIEVITKDFQAGANTITVDARDLGGNGVFYYTVRAGEHTDTKRMVFIK